MNTNIYMDYNATTPMLPEVKDAMLALMGTPLNPSSIHKDGKFARKILDTTRAQLLQLCNLTNNFVVIFTSSGTEANNLAILGLKETHTPITTTVEHSSVLSVIGEGVLPVHSSGLIDLDALKFILEDAGTTNKKLLISVQFANNETGVIQPIKQIAELVHEFGHIIHVDATQAFGKESFDAADLGIDLFTVTAHKFGGPLGAAALVFNKEIPLKSVMKGGGQEQRFRPGTQNTLAIAGFSKAIESCGALTQKSNEVVQLRNNLEEALLKAVPDTILFGKSSPRLKNTSSIHMKNVSSETQVIFFDTMGISVSAGAA